MTPCDRCGGLVVREVYPGNVDDVCLNCGARRVIEATAPARTNRAEASPYVRFVGHLITGPSTHIHAPHFREVKP